MDDAQPLRVSGPGRSELVLAADKQADQAVSEANKVLGESEKFYERPRGG